MNGNLLSDGETTARNVSAALTLRVLRYPVLVVYVITVPRLLGPTDYGEFAFIVALLTFLAGCLAFGTTIIFGRFAPEYIMKGEQPKLNRLFSSLLIFRVAVTALIGLVGLVALDTLGIGQLGMTIWIVVYVAMLAEQVDHVFFSYFFGLNRIARFYSWYLYRTILRLIFILLLYPWLGLGGAVLALLLTPICTSFYAAYSIAKLSPLRPSLPRLAEFWPHLKFGIAVAPAILMVTFQQQIGPIILKLFSVPAPQIGFYDLANQAFLLLYGFACTGFSAFIPIVAKYYSLGSVDDSVEWLLKFARYVLSGTCIIVAGFYAFGESLIVLLLGQEYQPVYPIALLMVLGVLFWIPGQICYVYSVTTGTPRAYLLSMLVSTIVFLGVAALVLSEKGVFGVAMASVSAGLAFSSSIMLVYRSLGSRILDTTGRVVIASVAWVPLYVLQSDDLPSGIVIFLLSVVIFVVVLRWFGLVDYQELSKLLRSLTRSPRGDVEVLSQGN